MLRRSRPEPGGCSQSPGPDPGHFSPPILTRKGSGDSSPATNEAGWPSEEESNPADGTDPRPDEQSGREVGGEMSHTNAMSQDYSTGNKYRKPAPYCMRHCTPITGSALNQIQIISGPDRKRIIQVIHHRRKEQYGNRTEARSDGEERPGVRKRGEVTILRLNKPQIPGSHDLTANERGGGMACHASEGENERSHPNHPGMGPGW